MDVEGEQSRGILNIIRHVMEIEETRATTYRGLEKALVEGGPQCALEVQRSTELFQVLSARMLELMNECESDTNSSLGVQVAGILRRIQSEEANKLRLTVEIQSLKKSGIMDAQEHAIGSDDEDPHQCACHSGLPAPHEVKAAVAEGYQQLEACIREIHECMEELQYIKDDLQ